MKKDHREKSRKIWLVGDSPPKDADRLRYPLDSHHFAVHCIWTSVLNEINARLFKHSLRLSDNYPHIRNAVTDSSHWKKLDYRGKLQDYFRKCKSGQDYEYDHLTDFNEHKPTIVITFGAKPFSIFKAISGGKIKKGWTSRELGVEFKEAINKFSLEEINLLPLLHTSLVYKKKYLEGQAYYCKEGIATYEKGNCCYFSYVGRKIARILLEHRDYLKSKSILLSPD